jgi:hypothetical protein
MELNDAKFGVIAFHAGPGSGARVSSSSLLIRCHPRHGQAKTPIRPPFKFAARNRSIEAYESRPTPPIRL